MHVSVTMVTTTEHTIDRGVMRPDTSSLVEKDIVVESYRPVARREAERSADVVVAGWLRIAALEVEARFVGVHVRVDTVLVPRSPKAGDTFPDFLEGDFALSLLGPGPPHKVEFVEVFASLLYLPDFDAVLLELDC